MPPTPAPRAAPLHQSEPVAPVASPTPEKQATASELFAKLPADEQAKRAVLERICAPAIGRYTGEFVPQLEGQLVFGCSCCAPFEECPPTASAELVVAEPGSVYTLRHWHQGSFTKPGVKEMAATFMGCEPGADNRGGTLVLSERGVRLEPVAYRSGVNPDSCQVLAQAGQRDRLVCLSGSGMGSTNTTQLLLVDLASETDNVAEIASFDADGACLLDAEPYVSILVRSIQLVDANRDQRLDVVVEATADAGVLSEAQRAACTDDALMPPTLPSPAPERFVYLARANGFVADAATAKRLEALYRARNAHRRTR